jgi:hypothetical protein
VTDNCLKLFHDLCLDPCRLKIEHIRKSVLDVTWKFVLHANKKDQPVHRPAETMPIGGIAMIHQYGRKLLRTKPRLNRNLVSD